MKPPTSRPVYRSTSSDFRIKPTHLKVLLVEDDSNDQIMITRALDRCCAFDGITVTSVFAVDTARSALAVEDFDVIISDFLLHGECGAELFRTPDIGEGEIATILVTGIPTPEVRAYAMQAGAMICLGKDELTSEVLDEALLMLTNRHDRSGVACGLQGDPTHRADRRPGRHDTTAKREVYAH
jgi:DNA-binding NtrC family response regulator